MQRALPLLLALAACGGAGGNKPAIRAPEARDCGDRPATLTADTVKRWGESCVQAAKEAEESLVNASEDSRKASNAPLADCLDNKRAEVRTVREVMNRDLAVIGRPGPLELDAQLIERRYDRVQRLVDEALECSAGDSVAGADAS